MSSRRIVPVCLLLVACTVSPCAVANASNSIPGHLRETRAVYSDLAKLRSECEKTITLSRQLRGAVSTVRRGVDQSIDVTQLIRAMDRRLVKLIDRLKPYQSIPKVRTVTRTLAKNLSRVQQKIHTVRKKTDQCEAKVLRPTRDRLRKVESTLRTGEAKLRELSMMTATLMANVSQAARTAQGIRVAESALEATSRSLRPVTQAMVRSVVSVRSKADSLGYAANRLNGYFSSFRTVGSSLSEMSSKMEGGEKLVGKLDSVLGKKLSIKIPFSKKTLSVSVRDILEKTGQVLNIVLKPLEKLADKVLSPVLGKLKLEMKMPRGLDELNRQIDSLYSVDRKISSAINGLERQIQHALARQLNRLRMELNRPLECVNRSRQQRQVSNPRQNREPVGRVEIQEPKRTNPVFFLIAN